MAALAVLASPRRRKALFIFAVAGLLAIVAGCNIRGNAAKNDSLEASEDVFARVGGWIAFRSGPKIVAVDPANPGDTLVLGHSLDDDPIAWSSDGTKLLLHSRLEESGVPLPGLFVLQADGSRTTLRPETNSAFRRDPPTWGSFSPDGTEVAYAGSGRSRGPYIIDADGGKPRPLGRCQNPVLGGRLCGEPAAEAAAWSPDGSRIAWYDFVEDSAKYGHHAGVLSFVNPDGTGLREEVARLTGEAAYSLVWSPDGSRLAFWHDEDPLDDPGKIFIVNADGSGLQRITDEGRWPTWSPDGSRIAFVHNGTLSTMAPDGTDIQSVQGVTPDGAIAWNPLG
jgi:Tol biopolymer transport system component